MRTHRFGWGAAAAFLALYFVRWRRPILTWGATETEANSRLPGDELLDDADGEATRAIDIRAPASAVWPWIAQMGPSPRGGAYTYDWIENLLGLNMHSTDTVLPEFQHPEVGDKIGFGSNRMRLARVEPERVLAWRSEDGNWVWTFVLNGNNGITRLISRNRFRLPRLVDRIGMVAMEPASLVMERKMLLGIKERAEHLVTAAGGGQNPLPADKSIGLRRRSAMVMPTRRERRPAKDVRQTALTAVKFVHTLAWFSIESCMVYVLWSGARGQSDRRAAIAAGVVATETMIFAADGFRCPLTQIAERLGAERGSVTDIYLPRWFAHSLPAIHVPLIAAAGYLHERNLRGR